MGEKIYTPGVPNDALRYMNDPALAPHDRDYFADRFQGSLSEQDDYGGIHWNSGIMNLAFYLMVKGGTHPRGKSTVNVAAIDPDFDVSLLAAAKIVYKANTGCLTPLSGFLEARQCTILHAGAHKASVAAAWDAVGVFARHIPAANVKMLSNWVTYVDTNLTLDAFNINDRNIVYGLNGTIEKGAQVRCAMASPDLVRPNRTKYPALLQVSYGNLSNPASLPEKACDGPGECTTMPASMSTSAFVDVVIGGRNDTVLLQVMCGKVPLVASLTRGMSVTGLVGRPGSRTALRVYRLGGIAKGEVVTCKTVGTSGNANLYVREGRPPYPLTSKAGVCKSLGLTSTESCTIAPNDNTSIYVSIHAVKSYSHLSLLCTTCKTSGLKCRRRNECCDNGMACDGSTDATKTCRTALAAGKSCVRSSQCSQGYACQMGRCARM